MTKTRRSPATNPFKTLRESLGPDVTQRVIAQRLNKTIQTISTWERGAGAPSLIDADELAVAYETTREVIEKAIVEANRMLSGGSK